MIVLHEGAIGGYDHPFRWQGDHDRVRSWIEGLVALYPDRVSRYPTDSLNSREGRTAILDFVGYQGPRNLDASFRFNASRGVLRFRMRCGFERLLEAGRPLLPASMRRYLWSHLGQHLHRLLK